MNSDTPAPTGVVLDESRTRALLYVAVQEGLLDNDPVIGDGFVQRLLEQPPTYNSVLQAKEQLVLGGKIFASMWLPLDWKGELFEKEIVVPLQHVSESNLLEISEVSTEAVLGLANSKGGDWTEEKLFYKRERFLVAERAWEVVRGKHNYDGVWIANTLGWLKNPDELGLTEEQESVWHELDSAISELRPIVEAVNDYKRILTSASLLNALCSVPTVPVERERLQIAPIEDSLSRQAIVKVSCDRLPRAPVAITLKETLRLSGTAAASEYRAKMVRWADLIRTQSNYGYESVLGEIESARKELAYSKTLSATGKYATVVGTITLAGSVAFPPLAAIGSLATIVGFSALAGEKIIEHRNRWAMFD